MLDAIVREQTTILLGLSALIAVIGLLYYVYLSRLEASECSTMTSIFGDLATGISSISPDLAEYQHSFKDFYVKSAYNCCSGGSYKNDFVSLCVLKNVLKQGVRGLDVEVFSIGDEPIISTSVTDNFYVKQTFNSVGFNGFMDLLTSNAFASSTAPNYLDPVVLHVRFKSTNPAMFKNMAKIFENYPNFLLGPGYSFEYHGKNLGDVPLTSLMGKVVVVADKSNPAFLDSVDLMEYVNMCSSGPFMRALPYQAIKYAPSIVELIEYNKLAMTIALPDNQANPENPSPVVLRETGCQLLAMRYSLVDENLDAADAFFSEAGAAFVLKPEKLRYVPIEIEDPPEQNPEVSYATRDVSSDYYQFDI